MVSPTFAEASAGKITRFSIVIWTVAASAETDIASVSAATIATIRPGAMLLRHANRLRNCPLTGEDRK
jgi:hypothetical protein